MFPKILSLTTQIRALQRCSPQPKAGVSKDLVVGRNKMFHCFQHFSQNCLAVKKITQRVVLTSVAGLHQFLRPMTSPGPPPTPAALPVWWRRMRTRPQKTMTLAWWVRIKSCVQPQLSWHSLRWSFKACFSFHCSFHVTTGEFIVSWNPPQERLFHLQHLVGGQH